MSEEEHVIQCCNFFIICPAVFCKLVKCSLRGGRTGTLFPWLPFILVFPVPGLLLS